ncbi:hypothetical protein LH47_00642 [Anoxybacillus thermarum]|uniref:Uncharacterized protein n=1 Tax=Anoxybacillus thermarum TaxID=404937 RepID=A0A0D0RUF3_9BACL|nr:hypothetical protein [Anoxybacillus thermarum]KIQ95232.1 hypothetical protein LH47_00642 [Anoxybacillus thermarum]
MVSTWKFNVIFALFGCIVAFFSSLLQNSVWTSMIRSLIAFVVFFVFAFIIRWMTAFIQKDASVQNMSLTPSDEMEVEQMIESLDEEEQQKVAEYIRQLLRQEEK